MKVKNAPSTQQKLEEHPISQDSFIQIKKKIQFIFNSTSFQKPFPVQ